MRDPQDILKEILSIDENNLFLKYIVERIKRDDYRGWHASQHNRLDLEVIQSLMQAIYDVVGRGEFAIPPGDLKDYPSEEAAYKNFPDYKAIVYRVAPKISKGGFNSVKKNFFPDMDRMGFLRRKNKRIGELTQNGINLINDGSIFGRYKKFTDAIDKLLGSNASNLAETIHRSEYAHEAISIYEFMFIFSDTDGSMNKIEILDSYRSLNNFKQRKVRDLIKEYANPRNFEGNKTQKRDFNNWKNQAQQIFKLLKATVYFEVKGNDCFRLKGGDVGFFENTVKRSVIPKKEYFQFHNVGKRNGFELHHIIPISHARNRKDARIIDNYLNLIYLGRGSHEEITRAGNKHVILNMTPAEATFSGFDEINPLRTKNEVDALYTRDQKKIDKVVKHNAGLLRSIYDFESPHPTSQRKP